MIRYLYSTKSLSGIGCHFRSSKSKNIKTALLNASFEEMNIQLFFYLLHI
jgi:hypothetical protein